MNIAACYESNCGGETVATEEIIRALLKRPDVHVISKNLPPLTHTGSVRFFGWVFWSISRWTIFLWKRRFVDCVYTTTFTAGVAAAIIKPLGGFRIVWHYHGTRLPPPPDGLRGKVFITQWMKQKVVYTLHVYFLRCANLIIVPSLRGKDDLRRIFGSVFSPIVHIIPNGVDLTRFSPVSQKKRSALRRRYGIAQDARVILSVGRLEKQKGIESLFSVFSLLVASERKAVLILAYPKTTNPAALAYKKELVLLAGALGIKKYISWKEGVKKIEELYRASDLVISLSQQETFSLVLLEAIASGVPVLSAATGAASTMLPRIDKRLVVRFVSPVSVARRLQVILQWTEAKQLLVRRRMNVLARVYTWDRCAKKIEKALFI